MTEQEAQNALEPTMTGDEAFLVMQNTLDAFLEAANVEAVYGEPIEQGETLIIPAAEVLSGLGFGVGGGLGGGDSDEGAGSGAGGGGGGGGRVLSRPVAVIVVSPQGVRVEPVVDVTKIALAGLTAGAFVIGMMMRLLSPKKALKDIQQGNWE
ncbi:MAG: hypothetical protein JXA78_14395 [Anaerolineales bacterium]|nr:hypothetical protein [Anaerolineales bacterium]